jgi:hypothetical protein
MALSSGATLIASAADPLLTNVELPYKSIYFPFGFPARIETNSRRVIKAAQATWGSRQLRFPEPPVLARVLVTQGEETECPPKPVYRAQRNLLTVTASRENYGCCDLVEGFAAAWLNDAVVNEPEYLSYCFLEGMIMSMIESLHLVSMHAACVAWEGSGVLLTGDSGAGKSSLAFACAKRGWTYVSDDCSALVRKLDNRSVIGSPHLIRFRENAADLFPEVRGRRPRIRANGDPSIEIRTAEMAGIRTSLDTVVDHVVFLTRGEEYGTRATLVPFPAEEARARLYNDVWPPELESSQEKRECMRRLLTAGTWELRYRDLAPAVDRLEELARRGQ